MKSWTPLWSTIVTSTLWGETKEARILFVTMLALKDADGNVFATVDGLHRLANLTLEECKVALVTLESPDLKTETHQQFEGRRIARIEGGWTVLNHLKYRDMVQTIKRKAYQAAWQKDYRAGKKKGKRKASGPTVREREFVKAHENGDTTEQDRLTDTSREVSEPPLG